MLAINIPADGLFLAIQRKEEGDLSKDQYDRIVEEFIGKFLEAKPDVIMLNVCYRRALTPSEVFDSYLYDVETDENGYAKTDEHGKSIKTVSPVSREEVSKYFSSFLVCARELLEKGIDVYETAVRKIRNAGSKVFLSIRMNDGHYTENPAMNSAFALKNGGEYTIGKDGVALDFSKKAVQNHFLEYVEELLNKYQIDGIELDWLRYPTVLSEEQRGNFSVLNGYMQTVRNLLDRYDKRLGLAVRVLANERDNLYNGVDVSQWIADGNTDIVTIENFYIPTNFEPPVSKWRKSIEEKNTSRYPYQLLCGTDWGVSCVQGYNIATTPSLIRGFADACYQRGADGIYLFNFFEENDTSSFEFVVEEGGEARLENCFLERLKAAREVDSFPRRYVHIGDSNRRYPILLKAGEVYEFLNPIKGSLQNATITVGCDYDEPLSVSFDNGKSSLRKEKVWKGFEYIPENKIGIENHFIYAVSQAAPYVKTAELALSAEDERIRIKNESLRDVKILWIESSCDKKELKNARRSD